MRVPIGLPEYHVADFEWLVDQLRAYGADFVADQLYWERTDNDEGWALRGPWKPTPEGYQRVQINGLKYARLREVCGVAVKVFLHRLVNAMMYPTPHGGVGDMINEPTVHHIDEDKLNCAPSNLAIVTGGENINKSRPYGTGFCSKAGHPIVGNNIARNGFGMPICRYCGLTRKRLHGYETGRTKQFTPLPNFWLWMLSQYADAPDPEIAMMHDTGLLVPVVV